jgi:hypothetical protein
MLSEEQQLVVELGKLAADPVERAAAEMAGLFEPELGWRLFCLSQTDEPTYEALLRGCPADFPAMYRRYMETEDLTELLAPLAVDPFRISVATRRYAAWLLFVLGELPGS